jgi:hypothetical protein
MLTISRKAVSITSNSQLFNIPFDLNKISKVKLDTNRLINPSLWIIYLYAITKDNHERVARIWVFDSEDAQFVEFQRINKHLSINILAPAA